MVASNSVLDKTSRSERLRELVVRIVRKGERPSAFDLAVQYNRSVNVIYRDIKLLRAIGAIPKDFALSRREGQ